LPMKTVHCRICGYSIKGTSFQARMKKLRSHRKLEHPKAHKESVKKTSKTKSVLDPIKQRKKLIATPRVLKFKDFKGSGLIRVLTREGSFFPEFALYPNHVTRDMMLSFVDAGFTDEGKGKWVLRTNKFSIFVYV